MESYSTLLPCGGPHAPTSWDKAGAGDRWDRQVGDRAPFQHPHFLTFPPALSPGSVRVFLSGLDSSSILPNALLTLKPQKPNICFLHYLFSTVS